jgi:hypothetical protein
MLTFKPIDGLNLQLEGRYYTDYYARFDPTARTNTEDAGQQVWKVPDYYLFDMHFSYRFPIKDKYHFTIFGHVFNILNSIYVSDAVDNFKYTALDYHNPAYWHTVNNAAVFVGLPRTFNLGFKFEF